MMSSMTRQLRLIETSNPWAMDLETRVRGRRGVSAARAALANAPTLFDLDLAPTAA